MEYLWYVITGVISGIIAGMGMGGGTLLIPILTIFFNIAQKEAQGINLLAFIPCAIISLIIHIKNKLVDFKLGIPIIISGILTSIGGSFLAIHLQNIVLKKLFGIFLLVIGIVQIGSIIFSFIKKKKKKKQKYVHKCIYKCH